jgi:hypothetical protein
LKDSSEFVFGLTLTELIIITFFILLLLLVVRLENEEKESESFLTQVRTLFLIDKSENKSEIFLELVEAKDRLDKVNALVKDDDQLKDLAELQSLMKEQEQIIGTQKGQLSVLQARMNKSGDGIPPCWIDENGNYEYIYSVLIKDELIFTKSAYPATRHNEFMRIKDAEKLSQASGISIAKFLEYSRGAFEESNSREPICRFYVIIYDQSTNLDLFKSNLLQVQNHFYQLSRYKPGVVIPKELTDMVDTYVAKEEEENEQGTRTFNHATQKRSQEQDLEKESF